MKKDEDILAKFSKDPGFRVPEGYFSDFAKKMAESLPERVFTPEKKPALWAKVRPWVYMAAMFGGVWCMMYIFSDLKSRSSNPLDYNESIAEAMGNEEFVDDYLNYGTISDYDIYMDGLSSDVVSDTSAN